MSMSESLVALLVISIGLLGIAALQITSLKLSSNAQWHSQAIWFNYEITDRMSANRDVNGNILNDYNGIDTSNDYDQDCTAAPCSPQNLALADATEWKALVTTLPEGRGVIRSLGANAYMVTVMWNDGQDESNCTNGEPDPDGMTCFTVTVQ